MAKTSRILILLVVFLALAPGEADAFWGRNRNRRFRQRLRAPKPAPIPAPAPVGPECTGRTVTVKRMDPSGLDGHGWGMNLQFMCGDSRVNIGNSRGSQTQSTVVNTPMHKGDCPARINKSNWLGGYTYPDFFDVTVTDCPGPAPVPVPEPVPRPRPLPRALSRRATARTPRLPSAASTRLRTSTSASTAPARPPSDSPLATRSTRPCPAMPLPFTSSRTASGARPTPATRLAPRSCPMGCADPPPSDVCRAHREGICDTLQQSHDGCTSGSKAVVEKSNEYLSVDVQNAPCAAPIMEDTFASLKKYKLAYNDWAMAFNNASQVCKVGANIREYNGISFMSMHKSLEDVERVANDACAELD